MNDFSFVENDDLRPSEIEHRCEEMYDAGGKLQQKYNYVVYHFAAAGRFFYARAYLDEIGTVNVYGPFEGRNYSAQGASFSGRLDDAMLAYLKRRFVIIQRLGREGYVTVWKKSDQ